MRNAHWALSRIRDIAASVLRALLLATVAFAAPLPGATSFAVCKTTSIPYPPHALAAAGGSLWIGCGARVQHQLQVREGSQARGVRLVGQRLTRRVVEEAHRDQTERADPLQVSA